MDADPAPGVIDAILGAETVLIAPSNPYLSIDPILSVAPIRRALEEIDAPVIAVSPIVGGKAVKGPTAKLMAELGVPVDNAAIAALYHGVNDGLLIDTTDSTPSGAINVGRTDTLMCTPDDKMVGPAGAKNLGPHSAPPA